MEVEEGCDGGKLRFDKIGIGDRDRERTSNGLVSIKVGEDWVSWAEDKVGEWAGKE